MSGNNFEVHLSFNALSGGFMQAFMARYREKIMSIFEKEDATEGADSALAQISAMRYPEQINAEEYISRQPYAKEEFLHETIAGAEQRGWITRDGAELTATKKAQSLTDQLVQLLEGEFNPLADQVSVDLPLLVSQLASLVENAEEVSLPLNPTFSFARKIEHQDKTPSLSWVRRHLITLGSYRDDCHMSSWQKHPIPGYLWETLSFIWEGEINTPEKLAETLSGYRGYQQEDYQSAIDQLIDLGWVEAEEEHYIVTKHGRAVREEAEDLTNEYFVKAFSSLSEAELKALNAMFETITAEVSPEPQAEE